MGSAEIVQTTDVEVVVVPVFVELLAGDVALIWFGFGIKTCEGMMQLFDHSFPDHVVP